MTLHSLGAALFLLFGVPVAAAQQGVCASPTDPVARI
jgi:hypothetical protein